MPCTWGGSGYAQTAEDLLNASKNTENVITFRMGYDLQQYSALKQINKSNVKQQVPIWSACLSNEMGEHAQRQLPQLQGALHTHRRFQGAMRGL